MNSRRIALISALLVVAGFVAWLLLREQAATKEAPSSAPSHGAPEDAAPSTLAATESPREKLHESIAKPAEPSAAAEKESSADSLIEGRVTDDRGNPIEGASVWLALFQGNVKLWEARTASDALGNFAALVPPPKKTMSFTWIELRGEARSKGCLDAEKGQVWDERSESKRMDFSLMQSPSLRGRVLCPDKTPAANAYLFRAPGKPGNPNPIRSRSDGSFQFPLSGAGNYRVIAEHLEFGAAASDILSLSGSEDADLGDLVLSGPGTLGGVARFSDGSPATTIALVANSKEYNDQFDPHWRDLEAPEANDGWRLPTGIRTGVRTDASGRFRFSGLREGEYFLKPHVGFDFGSNEEEKAYATGDMGIDLVIPQRILILDFIDEQGRPVGGAHFVFKGLGPEDEGAEDYQRTPILSWDSPQESRAQYSFFVSAGDRYSITAFAPLAFPETVEIEIESWEFKKIVPIVLKPAPPDVGNLEWEFRDPTGRIVSSVNLHLEPTSADGDEPAISYGQLQRKDPKHKAPDPVNVLRPGKYKIRVSPGEYNSFLLPFEKEIEIRPGQTTRLEETFAAGGKLLVRWIAPEGVKELKGVIFRVQPKAASDAGASTNIVANYNYSSMPIEEPLLFRKLLPAGEYSLEIQVEGFRVVQKSIFVDGGGKMFEEEIQLIPEKP